MSNAARKKAQVRNRRRSRWALVAALVVIGVAAGASVCAYVFTHGREATAKAPPPGGKPGMVWVPGGEFVMGTDDPKSMVNEHPAHRVKIDGFWIDPHDGTNAEFRAFIEKTGYLTTAERKPEWEEMRKQLP